MRVAGFHAPSPSVATSTEVTGAEPDQANPVIVTGERGGVAPGGRGDVGFTRISRTGVSGASGEVCRREGIDIALGLEEAGEGGVNGGNPRRAT